MSETIKSAYAEKNGTKMASAIGSAFNTFGKPKMEDLTEEEMTAVKLCGYLTLFELSDWWERCDCNGWDDRKKASAVFAYRNRELLAEQFKTLTGLDAFPEKPDWAKDYNLGRVMDIKPARDAYKDAGYEWMPDFVSMMEREHSTLQQSFIRWFFNDMLMKEYPEDTFLPNTDGYGVSFPFI